MAWVQETIFQHLSVIFYDWHFSTGALKTLVNAFHFIGHTEKLKKVTVIVIIYLLFN